MKKLILIIALISLGNIANAQINVTMFINGDTINNWETIIGCKDSCYNFTVSVSGGLQPYTYQWNNGATTQSNVYCTSDMQNLNDSVRVIITDANSSQGWSEISLTHYLNFCQEICIVTIDSATNKNVIVWNQSSDTTITSYNIYKETAVTNVFDLLGNVPITDMSVFIDSSSQPSQISSRYTIKAANNCGAETYLCSVHKTMHLAINQGTGNTWNLIWEPYQGIPVATYLIYRGSTANNLQLITTTSSSNTSFTDLSAPSGFVYYQIEITNSNSCNNSKSYNTSKSNIATNDPNGINDISLSKLIHIFPNPVTEWLTIEVPQKSIIEIFNINGQVIKTIFSYNTSVTIDLKDFSSGVYIVSAKTDKEFAIKKFIKD